MSNLPHARKSLGQHWLFDVDSLSEIVEAAEVDASDHVLEIGPGLGTLTEMLLAHGAHVIAVELDKDLYQNLKKEAANFYNPDAQRLTLVNEDILKFDLTSMPPDYKVVANIPYYLTSNLIRVLSESTNRPEVVAMLVQKEVAERVTAKPGDMSLLSVSAQFYWEVSKGLVVPASLFTPPPKVDSQILVLRRRNRPLFSGVDEKLFFQLVKAGFSNRRKTLSNSLAGGLQQGKQGVSDILEACEINPKSRPQELSLEDWHRLYKKFLANK